MVNIVEKCFSLYFTSFIDFIIKIAYILTKTTNNNFYSTENIMRICKQPKKATPKKIVMENGMLLETMLGNNKIPTTTMIINMGSAESCPSDALGLCPMGKHNGDGSCYALKPEKQYPPCLPYRNRQENVWKKSNAKNIAKAINILLAKNPYVDSIRFNEAGDFYTENCITKLSQIASMVTVPVYTYTHRDDLFNYTNTKNLNKNLTINFSKVMPFNHEHNEFILNGDVRDGVDVLPCIADCSVCSLCVKRHKVTIGSDKH